MWPRLRGHWVSREPLTPECPCQHPPGAGGPRTSGQGGFESQALRVLIGLPVWKVTSALHQQFHQGIKTGSRLSKY